MTDGATISKNILERLKISEDRFNHIMLYIGQMIKDYKGSPIDVIKEIDLNLKGNERYIALYATGSYFHNKFIKMSDVNQSEFVDSITDGLKISGERADKIQEYMMKITEEYFNKNISQAQVFQEVVNSQFSNTEKDFIIFTFGLINFVEYFYVR